MRIKRLLDKFFFSFNQYSFIHSFRPHFHSASSNPLLLRGAPDTARILCRSFTPKRHRQLRVKNLHNIPTWRLERDSNPRPSGWKVSTQQVSYHVHIILEPVRDNRKEADNIQLILPGVGCSHSGCKWSSRVMKSTKAPPKNWNPRSKQRQLRAIVRRSVRSKLGQSSVYSWREAVWPVA